MASTLAATQQHDIKLTHGKATLETDPVIVGAIKLRNRLLLFLGEWFLDTRIGFPWFQYVLIKNPVLGVIRRVITKTILSTPPFVSVPELVLDYRPETRTLTFYFQAVAQDGRVLFGGSDKPFIVRDSK